MKFKIESDVPFEEPGHTRWPFKDLQPGQSVFLAGHSTYPGDLAYAAAKYAQRNNPGWKIRGRTVTENGVKGLRVWRVE